MSQHIVLLGDSIFDNAAYVPGRCPAVIDHVRSRLPVDWQATLLAVDGSVIADVYRQLGALPHDATHLVLSAGGNDALSEVGTLQETVKTVGQGLRVLAEICERFRRELPPPARINSRSRPPSRRVHDLQPILGRPDNPERSRRGPRPL